MNSNLFFEIVKKQQELINLIINDGLSEVKVNSIPDAYQNVSDVSANVSEVLANKIFVDSKGHDEETLNIAENRTDFTEQQKCETDYESEHQECISFSDNQENKCDLDGFIQWMKRKGMSQNGINSYKYTINEFFSKYGLLNNDSLAQYEQYLKDNRNPKTVNLRISGMSKYLKYINYTDYEFTRAKVQKQTFCDNAINETQFNQLIDWAKDNNTKVWLIAKVLGSTGVRASELIELRTEDLHKGYVDIIGKGNKQRRIYFPAKLVGEIKDKCGKEYIIENKYGGKITTRGVAQLLVKNAEKAGIPKEVMHPHSFRHFFAKQFMKKTQDISLLGDLLGHSNIATTAIYTRLTTEEQQNEINKLINW